MTTSPVDAASPSDGEVQVEIRKGIGTVRFGHPKGNSLPSVLLQRLADAIAELGADASARVVVLRSRGTGPFCAGASFDELVRIADEREGERFFSGFARVILAMIRAPKLVLVRVQGKTAGGGVGIAAAGDYTLAARGASCKLSELAVGIGPFVVGPVIEHRIGRGPYAAMAVDADWRDAGVDDLAATLASSNPAAMSAMKRVFWEGTSSWEEMLIARARMSGELVLSDHTRAAIAKFKGK